MLPVFIEQREDSHCSRESFCARDLIDLFLLPDQCSGGHHGVDEEISLHYVSSEVVGQGKIKRFCDLYPIIRRCRMIGPFGIYCRSPLSDDLLKFDIQKRQCCFIT
jgi:hypothetical protein